MYAISFDLEISNLKIHYGEPYNHAYYEIRTILENHSFEWIQGSTYMTQIDDLSTLFDAVNALAEIEWFVKSVRDIRGFKVESWSNFTNSVKKRIKP